jgi:hypothetical protein
LEIEIVHRRLPADDGEQLSINLQAVPSFEAFGRFIQTANPFAFWAFAVQTAGFPWFPFPWFQWLGPASALMLPWSAASGPPKLGSGHSESDKQNRPHT